LIYAPLEAFFVDEPEPAQMARRDVRLDAAKPCMVAVAIGLCPLRPEYSLHGVMSLLEAWPADKGAAACLMKPGPGSYPPPAFRNEVVGRIRRSWRAVHGAALRDKLQRLAYNGRARRDTLSVPGAGDFRH